MDVANITETPTPDSTQLLSSSMRDAITLWLVSVIIAVAPLGLVGNVINILVFYKMGLTKSSINKSFFSLAICDLFGVFWMALLSVGRLLLLLRIYLRIEIRTIIGLTSPTFYSCSAFGSWVTTIISLERSCCVVFPMKVKFIFTQTSINIILVAMGIYQVGTSIPFYFTVEILKLTNPVSNLTFITIGQPKNTELALLSQTLSYSIPTLVCFIIVVIATVFLITTFKKSRKLRHSMTSNKDVKMASHKDARLIRSVISLCIIYIFGYFLSVALFFCDMVGFPLNLFDPRYGNLTNILFRMSFLCQTLACSANIAVYLKMNTSYRETFKKLINIGK